jgi:hypothetical protein
VGPLAASPYRGALPLEPPPGSDPSLAREPNWARLASEYLDACGHEEIAAIAGRAHIEVRSALEDGERRHHATVTLAPRDATTPRIRLAFLETCLRDLLEGPRRAPVRVDF